MLTSFEALRPTDVESAVVAAVQLLASEGKYPIERITDTYYFPINRLRNILMQLLSKKHAQQTAIDAFRRHTADYLDVLFYSWKLLPGLTIRYDTATFDKEDLQIYIRNYFDLVAALPIPAVIQNSKRCLCFNEEQNTEHGFYNKAPLEFDYDTARKNLNKSWHQAVMWPLSEQLHRQMLIVLLEHVLMHLFNPVLLTDFLMDSLDAGGPVSLLALQGIFTLIQQHNLTYPNVYEKLYLMFQNEVFYTKFKARLFYLADIFLSSISLPETLVAAFIKRLSRLALVAPPQDILIILSFIENLFIRHPGLQCVMYKTDGNKIKPVDLFLQFEQTPKKTEAIRSSLWEVASLQHHVLPSIAKSACFIQKPVSKVEHDLAHVLELQELNVSIKIVYFLFLFLFLIKILLSV